MTNNSSRLALFIPTLHSGGVERIMLNLARGLNDRHWPVDLVVVKAAGEFAAEIPPGIRIIDLRARRVRDCLPGLYRYLATEKPAALLAAMGHVNVAALLMRRLARSKTRIVVSVHESMSRTSWSQHPLKKRLVPWLNGFFYPWSDAIVAVSDGAADDLARIGRLPRTSIRTIYNPVVMPDLRERGEEPLDHPWFAKGAPPVIVGVGRLTAQKNFAGLIRAFHRVRQARPARLMILGEGHERGDLERLVVELSVEKDVLLPGFVTNPYRYMARASLFALSSGWEALPTVLIEAMAMGTPVVATDCPSGPREILSAGRYGRLVPVNDDLALAGAILQTLGESDPCGAARRERIERAGEFSLERAVDNYLAVMVGSAHHEGGG